MIAMAAAMRLQTEGGALQAQKIYSFDVKPRWPLADLVV
jgi:N6-L-threonylcarbamoyladenine synthase